MGDATVPIQVQMSDFLKLLYVHGEKTGWAEGLPLREIAEALEMPMGLVVKISKHLEHARLLEYENGTVDLTIEGIMRVQQALVAKPVSVPPPTNGSTKKGASKKSKS